MQGKQTTRHHSLLDARKIISDREKGIMKNRLDLVAEINDVKYVNDSAASSIDATWLSIESMPSKLVWIIGGYNKSADYNQLRGIANDKVSALICYGENKEKIIDFFLHSNFLLINAEDVNEAVYFASLYAKPENHVLYSPACPSYIMGYKDVDERAQEFINAVSKLSH